MWVAIQDNEVLTCFRPWLKLRHPARSCSGDQEANDQDIVCGEHETPRDSSDLGGDPPLCVLLELTGSRDTFITLLTSTQRL